MTTAVVPHSVDIRVQWDRLKRDVAKAGDLYRDLVGGGDPETHAAASAFRQIAKYTNAKDGYRIPLAAAAAVIGRVGRQPTSGETAAATVARLANVYWATTRTYDEQTAVRLVAERLDDIHDGQHLALLCAALAMIPTWRQRMDAMRVVDMRTWTDDDGAVITETWLA